MVMVQTKFEDRWEAAFERILSKITIERPYSCWIYHGNVAGPKGYCRIVVARKRVQAHIIAARGFKVRGWEFLDSSNLPVVHHECRKTACVNPDHLIVFASPRDHEAHHREQAASRGEKRAGARGAGNYMYGRRKDGTTSRSV